MKSTLNDFTSWHCCNTHNIRLLYGPRFALSFAPLASFHMECHSQIRPQPHSVRYHSDFIPDPLNSYNYPSSLTVPIFHAELSFINVSSTMACEQPPNASIPPVYHEGRVLVISCLTTVATIIGSGILALPVSLYNVSLNLFLITFTIIFFCQVSAIFVTVELMQLSQKRLLTPSLDYQSIHPLRQPHDTHSLHLIRKPRVSLFLIARHYFRSYFLRSIFYVFTFLSFLSMLVSYGLAGPQAIWQILHPSIISRPPMFLFYLYWAVGTIAVIFFLDALLAVFGGLTVIKGALFVSVVVLVAAVPRAARPFSIVSLFSGFGGLSNLASPFLIGIVALGGISNTLPVTFNLLPPNASKLQVTRYRTSVILGLFFCYLLNVGWVLAVLQVVPRSAPEGQPSLTESYQRGHISTVPLIAVLERHRVITGAALKAIEVIVELFIIISTGVSFFVIAAGLKSFVDGIADAILSCRMVRHLSPLGVIALGYILSFGSVLLIIVSNPRGFISIMTHLSSLSFIVQGGLLLFWMLLNARRSDDNLQTICLKMSPRTVAGWTIYSLPLLIFAAFVATAGPIIGIKMGEE